MCPVETDSYTPDNLIAGGPIKTQEETVLSGESLARGEAVGKVTRAVGTPTYSRAGTSDGTVGSVTMGKSTQLGNFVLTCIAEAANAGTFQVVAPDGTQLPDATVAVAYTNDQINFTIADGAEDWDLTDEITIPIEAGSGKVKALDADNVDGSGSPHGIMAAAVDASLADKAGAVVFIAGEFNQDEVTFADGEDYDTHREAFRDLGIYLRDPLSA